MTRSPRRRDRLGRPLAHDAPAGAAGPPVPDVRGASDDQAWLTAIGLLEADLPFHAHEVFEQRWRDCAPEDRQAWRALAQWAAALTHAARGNREGARRLADRALRTLEAVPPQVPVPAGIDLDLVRASCAVLLDR